MGPSFISFGPCAGAYTYVLRDFSSADHVCRLAQVLPIAIPLFDTTREPVFRLALAAICKQKHVKKQLTC
jgi:hypothetical protein